MSDPRGAPSRPPGPGRRPAAAALLAVLLLAAGLRLAGLGAGLRHPPHSDERVFVEAVQQMIASGDLDHRYYEYPGLVFYLLLPVLRLVPGGASPGPTAYLAARALVAVFGVLACGALYLLGRQLGGRRLGLLAAALLAVSPVAVETGQAFRPDVVLLAFAVLALLAFARLGTTAGGDLRAGLALGLAGAVKFSAAVLVPAYLVARALTRVRRGRGVALAGAVAVLVFLLATPAAVLNTAEFLGPARVQLAYHYKDKGKPPVAFASMLLEYLRVSLDAVGGPAATLALAGAFLARRRWRELAPPLVLYLTGLAVLSTSDVRHERFLLPALPAVYLLAAQGAVGLARSRPAFAALSALALAVPLWTSGRHVAAVSGPSTRDRIVDWLQENAPPGARVLNQVPLLGLGTGRFQVLETRWLEAANRPQVLEADLVLSMPAAEPAATAGLDRAFVAARSHVAEGPEITVWRVPPALRPTYRLLELEPPALAASENAGALAAACDADPATAWRTAGAQRPGDWLEARLSPPAAVARVEVLLDDGRFAAREATVLVTPDAPRQEPPRVLPGRFGGPPAQVWLLSPPVAARAVRLQLLKPGARRWGVAELRLFVADIR